jgi:hypothetical protein
MSSQIVPLTPLPNQTLSVTLNINNLPLTLQMFQYYNRVAGFWAIDIYSQTGVPLASSVPLLTGDWPAANILAPYEYLQIGEAYVINQNGGVTDWPTTSNLGGGFVLLWTDNVGSGKAPGFPLVPPVPGSGDWSSYPVSGLAQVLQ